MFTIIPLQKQKTYDLITNKINWNDHENFIIYILNWFF